MKRIPLRKDGPNHSVAVFKLVLEQSPQKPLSIAEERSRVGVMEAVEKVDGDSLILEESEHATLKKCLEDFPWTQARADLLQIIDDVLEAKPVSKAALKAVDAEK